MSFMKNYYTTFSGFSAIRPRARGKYCGIIWNNSWTWSWHARRAILCTFAFILLPDVVELMQCYAHQSMV